MIITQTPLRISFLGGGTDFREFYSKEGGCVLSSAIDKFVFVIVKERFDNKIYVNYSKKEIVDHIDELQHGLVREAMRMAGVTKGIEITTLADVPSEGIGLGSSSSITVSLLHALYTYRGILVTEDRLAREACEIEIDILGKPIGKQDQYIAAFGNMRLIHFNNDESVDIETVNQGCEWKEALNRNLMLFFTNITRDSSSILNEQRDNIHRRMSVLRDLKAHTLEAKEHFLRGDWDALGELMHRGWELKKELASRVTNSGIDAIYNAARSAGAIGGKITGAGGGGFLLVYCPIAKQDSVRAALAPLRSLPFNLEWDGSKVIFNIRRR